MTVLAGLVWGAGQWLAASATLAVVLLLLLAWGYGRTRFAGGARLVAMGLKVIAVLLLAACLLEPLFSGQRARPGANQFLILADNSRSMTLRDPGAKKSRGEEMKALAPRDAAWLNHLAQDFDLREYAFDTQLRAVTGLDDLPFDGGASNLCASLDRLARRYQGRPLAGVLLFTDGNATDAEAIERVVARAKAQGPQAAKLPPIYPVIAGSKTVAPDINLQQVAVTQTNFEDAPVTVTAHIGGTGFANRDVTAELLDESGKSLEKQTVRLGDNDTADPAAVRFKVKPEQPGVSFYRVRVGLPGQKFESATQPAATQPSVDTPEATLANNVRVVAVDRGQGPYRVLYVAGRPNWEYKFLNRAVASDQQVQLVGLLRVAKREPKFSFIAHGGEIANPLFRGFDNTDKDQVAEYDQPVLVRIGTEDESELRGGFPKSPEDLYKYHAIIIDDLESEFFTQDQMQLIKEFVRQRGGGLLMLGGQETFKNGRYDRTPIGDLLPVYADDASELVAAGGGADVKYRMALTREGLLEPWVRLRGEEVDERKRVEQMSSFQVLNGVRGIKPGATVLARAAVEGGEGTTTVPALVEQRFGQGRVAALLIGDLWRWGMHRQDEKDDDIGKAWRQTVRWLVAEVPKRVEVTPVQATGSVGTIDDEAAASEGPADASAVTLRVKVRDAAYAPLDNATVKVRVTGPDGKPIELTGEPSERERGVYAVTYVPRQAGAYRASVTAAAPDASEVGIAQTGWTSDPAADEFQTLPPNTALLERLARETGGQVIDKSDIDSFVASLPTRHAEITEPYVKPVWHQPWVFLLAILCLAGEWGLRRWRGLP
jgi:uncharacterized membrane protein